MTQSDPRAITTMSEYLLMMFERENEHEAESPERMSEIIRARAAFASELGRTGQLVDAARFRPSKEGKRVGRVGEHVVTTDGPFAESGRTLAGYGWVKAESPQAATAIAERWPTLPSDEIDVRPLMKGFLQSSELDEAGKVFGLAVLGNAASESGWVDVMDRIDVETHDGFPKRAIVGGLRLQPPTTGKRVVTRAERRASFDGPFLESKEVIGGLFFLRMSSIDEVVEWARHTPFVRHGALEIRERWRT